MKGPVDPKYLTLAQRLREVREHTETSQRALARAIGVTHKTIQRYEKGQIHFTVQRLEAMAQAMHVPEQELRKPPGAPIVRTFRPQRPKHSPPTPPGLTSAVALESLLEDRRFPQGQPV